MFRYPASAFLTGSRRFSVAAEPWLKHLGMRRAQPSSPRPRSGETAAAEAARVWRLLLSPQKKEREHGDAH